MFANLRIAHRLLIGFGLMMLIVAGLSGLAVTSSEQALTKIDTITRAKNNEANAQLFGKTIAQGLTRLWMAMATGDQSSWKGQQDAFALALRQLVALKQSTLDAGRSAAAQRLFSLVSDLDEKATSLKALAVTPGNQALSKNTAAIATIVADAQALEAAGQELAGNYAGAAISRTSEATREAQNAIVMAIVLGCTSVLVGLALSFFISRSISAPILTMARTMQGLAAGQLGIAIVGRDRGDEVGAMANAVQVFKDSMIEADRLAQAERAAQQQTEARVARIEQLNRDFDSSATTALDMLTSAATELTATVGSLSESSSSAVDTALTVAQASAQASVNVQTVAAATEQLASSIREISRQISDSADVAGKAVNEAADTRATMQELSAAAQKIDGVVRLISDIAGRTNLLALNATIEAARAGDAGKGFAVVATEVKSLATQTARATDEIALQVSAMQGSTSAAVAAIARIDTTIGTINEIASAIAAAVEQQNAATSEIARNVQSTAGRTTEVSSNIKDLTRLVEGTGIAAIKVRGAADEMEQQSATLRSSVGNFLRDIRAA
jgi:methyl-accepting chemotaxis protein